MTERGFVEASARDTKIAGYPVMVPMIDIETIGAGGGSVAYVDQGGAFRVGPRSAAANPGPACYGRGGIEPTVTDANLVLGRLDSNHFLGGEMLIHQALAEAAIDNLAETIGLTRHETAEGVVAIVNSNMANAVRGVTIRKGHDPRAFTLVAFGGAGPLHAAEVADSLDIPEVLIPPHPGLTSAIGLLTSDLKYDAIQAEFMLNSEADPGKLNQDFEALETSVRGQLFRDDVPETRIRIARAAECRYVGQGYELRVPVPNGPLNKFNLTKVWSAFHKLHRAEYGHSFRNRPIELVAIRLVGVGAMPKISPLRPDANAKGIGASGGGVHDVYFRVNGRLRPFPTRCYDRVRLAADAKIDGPAIILQIDSTTVIPPGWSVRNDPSGSLLLAKNALRRKSAIGRRQH